jgi:hypothetical protein
VIVPKFIAVMRAFPNILLVSRDTVLQNSKNNPLYLSKVVHSVVYNVSQSSGSDCLVEQCFTWTVTSGTIFYKSRLEASGLLHMKDGLYNSVSAWIFSSCRLVTGNSEPSGTD